MGAAEKDFLKKKFHSAGGLLHQICMEKILLFPKIRNKPQKIIADF